MGSVVDARTASPVATEALWTSGRRRGEATTTARSRRGAKLKLSAVAGRLTLTNMSVGLVAVVTGPLQARALGPTGRGELAAIMTPFLFLPSLASVGLGSYATWRVARGARPGLILGSMLPVTLGLGLIVAALSPLTAAFLANGRTVVETMLVVGMVIFPVGMLTNMLMDISAGLEDWRPVMLWRVIPPLTALFGIPALFVTNTLTVTTAAIVTFASSLLVLLPTIRILRESWPLAFSPHELRDGVSFGAKSWVGGLSNLANARLDQLLMILLVPSRVLGVYAIAVTLATFCVTPVASAISTAASPRLSRGENALARQLCRLTLAGSLAVGLCIGALSPFVLHYAFGPGFDSALPMTLVLLAAGVPNAAGGILNTAVSTRGRPDLAAWGEGLALIITVGGLIVALPALGGLGAALVSFVAYSSQCLFLLVATIRLRGGRTSDYLLITAEDLRLVRSLVMSRLGPIVGRRLQPT